MLVLIIVGIVVLVVGKLKLTRSIVLTGKRARWCGLTLVVTAIPFSLGVGIFFAVMNLESILTNPGLSTAINYAFVIGYIVLLTLLFREREKTDVNNSPQASV
jgi:hypothetical protein